MNNIVIVLLLLLVGVQAEAAVHSHGDGYGEALTSYLANKVNQSQTQKELLEKLPLEDKHKKEALDFLKKYRQEGVSVPSASTKGAMLNLHFKQGPKLVVMSLDLSGLDRGEYVLDGVKIQILPSDTFETIYKKIAGAAVQTGAKNLFVSEAYAETPDPLLPSKRFYVVYLALGAERNKSKTLYELLKTSLDSSGGSLKIGAWDCEKKTITLLDKREMHIEPSTVLEKCCSDEPCAKAVLSEIKANTSRLRQEKSHGVSPEVRAIPTH